MFNHNSLNKNYINQTILKIIQNIDKYYNSILKSTIKSKT